MQEDLTRGFEIKKPKPSTPAPSRSSHVKTFTPSTAGGSELEQLRASLADMDARLQAVVSERDSLKAEFNDYRKSSNEDVSDLERLNRDLKTQLRTTGMELSQMIASTGHQGPLPSGFSDDSPKSRTERAFMATARQMKSDTTGEPTTQRLERP